MLICAQYILPISSEPLVNGAVLIRDGIIRDIGKADMLKLRYPEDEVRDYGLAAIMPGLVDTHTHLEYSVMRGIVHDVPYTTWLMSLVDVASKMDTSDWFDSAMLGALDALASGITTVADITVTGAACNAVQKVGLRGVIYREAGAMDKRRVDHAMRSAEKDILHWREMVDSNRIDIGIAPAAIYTVHPQVFGRVSEFACKENLPVALHLAGSREEYNFVMRGSSSLSVHGMDAKRGYVEIPPWMPAGVTPVQYAHNWGAFESPRVLAIHAVHVNEDDIATMRRHDVSVAACPRCNAQLGMGVAPIAEFLRLGFNVGLGTDSPAATDSADMFEEMRLGMLIQRSVNVGYFLDSNQAIELATIGGARALGLDDKIGTLDVGKCADIIAVDLSSSHQTPAGDPISAVVNSCSAADVLMTMVNGDVLYEKNRWQVDIEVAKYIARIIEIRGKLRV